MTEKQKTERPDRVGKLFLIGVLLGAALCLTGLKRGWFSWACAQEGGGMATMGAPEFPEGMQWLNTGRPLTLEELRGKVVLLDFWTYCCINCIHVMPDLKKLEAKYPDELVVIGVHSAKFTTEKQTDNIRQAILRHELEHPVVNDNQMQVWGSYKVGAWPTLVLIDPAGRVVHRRSGENVFDEFDKRIAGLVKTFDEKAQLDRTPLDLALERELMPESFLSFPGKVLADEATGQLFIADSNHNRIVVVSLEDNTVKALIGSGETGFDDGDFDAATFDHPQGMAFDGETLYVADTENHALRAVDLELETVSTIAGTGEQARRGNVAGPGKTTALNSPWDLVLDGDNLYIAMAGAHQLWRFDLQTGLVEPFAGSGQEAGIDGPRRSAALAQPSGLASDGQKLYFADSEISTVRSVELAGKGLVETVAGSLGLFDFGDVDAKGAGARFQHPLGVAHHDGALYVADTYNNKIKRITLADGESQTFLGTGEAGLVDGSAAQFDEPAGISYASGRLYIADTNNNVIRVAGLKDKTVKTLDIETAAPEEDELDFVAEGTPLPAQSVRPGKATLTINIVLPRGTKLNPEAPSQVRLVSSDKNVLSFNGRASKVIEGFKLPFEVSVTVSPGNAQLALSSEIFSCEKKEGGLCFFDQVGLLLDVKVAEDAGRAGITITHELPQP